MQGLLISLKRSLTYCSKYVLREIFMIDYSLWEQCFAYLCCCCCSVSAFKNIAGSKAIFITWTSAPPIMGAAGILHRRHGRHAWARRDGSGGCSKRRDCPHWRTIAAAHLDLYSVNDL